jgi:hypothetical protein
MDLALIDKTELSLVKENSLNEHQLAQILKRTPNQYIKKRPAKGGGTWDYVTGGYVRKVLNLMFGWDWDFEILEHTIIGGEAVVKGRLTCRTNGKQIVKTQFGNKEIIYKKQTQDEIAKGLEKVALSIGNDLKAAATDALKKCAAEIGIAADIYNKEDFNEVIVDTENTLEKTLVDLYNLKSDSLSEDDKISVERIINEKETKSYRKTIKILQKL